MVEAGSVPLAWRKSGRCETHACVEVAEGPGQVAMRNSTLPEHRIEFTAAVWRDFIAGVRAGEFDLR
jgi:predicted secreted Zn-dependent protease